MKTAALASLLAPVTVVVALAADESPQRPWTGYAYPPAFAHIGTAQGLSHGTVYCTLQDKRGFLWFGTENGLNRYDGFEYKTYHFDKHDTESLSSDWINCLLEDRQGNLWVGTYGGGLNRIDKDTRKIVRYVPSSQPGGLASDNIRCLAEDADGNLWIGTGKGLFLLAAESTPPAAPRFEAIDPGMANTRMVRSGIVSSLHVDRQGAVWAGLEDGGMFRVRKDGGASRFAVDPFIPGEIRSGADATEAPPPPDALDIEEDTSGFVWIGSTHGLYSYRRANGAFHRYVHRPEDAQSLSYDLIRRVFRDRADGLWIATDGGGLEKMLPRARPEDPPRFQHFRHENQDPASLSSNAVESIYEDRSNVLWVGTYFMGLNKLILSGGRSAEREKRPLLQYKNIAGDTTSLSGNMVNAIAEDRFGSLWIGTDGYGLNRVVRPSDSGKRLVFEHFRADPNNPRAIPEDVVTGLFSDSRKQLWMTTFTAGLVRVDAASATAKPAFKAYTHDPKNPRSLAENFLWDILEDHSHRYWVATDIGILELFDPRRGTFQHFRRPGRKPGDISDDAIFTIVEDQFGTLWLGTFNGLARFNPATGEFKTYYQVDGPGGLSDSYIPTLCLDHNGNLWVGTNAGGLNKLAVPPWDGSEPQFTHFGIKDGLPSNILTGILEDDMGQLWISTAHALCRFDPQAGKAYPFIWHEELQRASFIRNSMYRSPSGGIFFGGSNGFSLFRPEEVVYNTYVPPMAITDFKLLNKSVPIQSRLTVRKGAAPGPGEPEAITLSAKDYEFSFEFAAMHFVAPDQNQYAYMMEGLDQDWNYSRNSHFIAYTTLPAGDYTFRAKGSNCDGFWGEEGIRIQIRILPPWWKTWWFRSALGILFTFVIFVTIRLRLQALRNRNRLLEAMVAEKTQETKDILNNIEQGLFTISLDGRVNADYALSTNAILGVDNVAAHSIRDLFRLDEEQQNHWQEWLELIRKKHDSMRWKSLADLAPVETLTLKDAEGERFVQIGYQRMLDREKRFNKLMILAQDVTEAKRNEKRMQDEKKLHESKVKAILGIVQNAATVPVFLEDLESRLEAIADILPALLSPAAVVRDQLAELLRETHTIKGTSATYGFEKLSAAALGFEDVLTRLRDRNIQVTQEDAAGLAARLEKMRAAAGEIRELAGQLMGKGGAATEALPAERVRKIQALCRAIGQSAGVERAQRFDELLELCRAIDYKRLGALAENYRHMLERVGERLGKPVEFRVAPEDLELSPKTFVALNEPLIHLLRNALDHGLESEGERERLGKPPQGVITLEIECRSDALVVSVADDGAGIDGDKVARKALALGLVTPERLAALDDASRAALIFSAGLSTRDEAGELSGRGVGLDVVADWVKAAGGRIAVQSQRGRGTRISLILPARFAAETAETVPA